MGVIVDCYSAFPGLDNRLAPIGHITLAHIEMPSKKKQAIETGLSPTR